MGWRTSRCIQQQVLHDVQQDLLLAATRACTQFQLRLVVPSLQVLLLAMRMRGLHQLTWSSSPRMRRRMPYG